MTDNSDFDINIPSVICMIIIVSSVGAVKYILSDKTFQNTTYLRQHARKVVYCTFVRTRLAVSFQFLVVRSRIQRPLK